MMPQSSRKRRAAVRLWVVWAALALACSCQVAPAGSGSRVPLESVEVEGTIVRGTDLSGVAAADERLFVASDEGAALQVLDPIDDGRRYRARSGTIPLLPGSVEIDLEGLSRDGTVLYAVGSHSRVRPRMKADRNVAENARRLRRIEVEPTRDGIFRVRIDEDPPAVERIDLRAILERDELLAPFANVPGKENGVDIEALADDGKRLFLGFRSPVLREDLVPVMVLSFDEPERYELRWIDLGGRGIRGMSRVASGFLLLAGFERGSDDRAIYLWDGSDGVPGRDSVSRKPRMLATLETPDEGRIEGITVIGTTEDHYDVIAVLDGATQNPVRRCRIPRR